MLNISQFNKPERYLVLQTHEECLTYLEQIRWGGGSKCPYCDSTKATVYKTEHRYRCNSCFTSYSVTVGTLFHQTHIELQVWFLAISLVLQHPEAVSARKLAKKIGVNKNTALYMIQRIRKAMAEELTLLQVLARTITDS